MFKKITKILIFCLLFLTDYRIFNIPIPTIVLLFSIIIIIIFHKNTSVKLLFLKDNIKSILSIILFFTIITYIIKSGNIESVKQIYYNSSGEKPDYLYLKMALNGLFFILTALLAFSIGLSYKGDEMAIKKIIKFIVNLITINALINIIFWLIQTGGVIGRYNFSPIIIPSFGINIQWSILGFILQLSNLRNNRKINFQSIKLIILFLSILIIQSRQSQLLFVMSLVFYFYLTSKNVSKLKVVLSSFIVIISIIYFASSIFSLETITLYQSTFDLQGDDILTRYAVFFSSLNIFKENILMGIGYGMFAGYNTTLIYVTGISQTLNSPHNGFMATLSEMGLIGMAINIVLAFKIIKRLKIINRNNYIYNGENNYVTAIYVFIFVNILSALISNYFLFPPPSEFSYYGIAFVSWLLIGIGLSNNYENTKTKKNAHISTTFFLSS